MKTLVSTIIFLVLLSSLGFAAEEKSQPLLTAVGNWFAGVLNPLASSATPQLSIPSQSTAPQIIQQQSILGQIGTFINQILGGSSQQKQSAPQPTGTMPTLTRGGVANGGGDEGTIKGGKWKPVEGPPFYRGITYQGTTDTNIGDTIDIKSEWAPYGVAMSKVKLNTKRIVIDRKMVDDLVEKVSFCNKKIIAGPMREIYNEEGFSRGSIAYLLVDEKIYEVPGKGDRGVDIINMKDGSIIYGPFVTQGPLFWATFSVKKLTSPDISVGENFSTSFCGDSYDIIFNGLSWLSWNKTNVAIVNFTVNSKNYIVNGTDPVLLKSEMPTGVWEEDVWKDMFTITLNVSNNKLHGVNFYANPGHLIPAGIKYVDESVEQDLSGKVYAGAAVELKNDGPVTAKLSGTDYTVEMGDIDENGAAVFWLTYGNNKAVTYILKEKGGAVLRDGTWMTVQTIANNGGSGIDGKNAATLWFDRYVGSEIKYTIPADTIPGLFNWSLTGIDSKGRSNSTLEKSFNVTLS